LAEGFDDPDKTVKLYSIRHLAEIDPPKAIETADLVYQNEADRTKAMRIFSKMGILELDAILDAFQENGKNIQSVDEIEKSLSNLGTRRAVIAHKLMSLEEMYYYELFRKYSKAQIEAMLTEMKNTEPNKKKEAPDTSRSIPGQERKRKIDFLDHLVNIGIREQINNLSQDIKKMERANMLKQKHQLMDALEKDDSIAAELQYARKLCYQIYKELVEEKKRQIMSLGNTDPKKEMEILISFLDDPAETVRSAAEKEILKKGEASFHALIADLNDTDSNTRWRSAWILGKIKERENAVSDEKVILNLMDVLPDDDPELRLCAIWALSEFHDERIKTAISETCSDEDRGVETICKEALVKLKWYENLSGSKSKTLEQNQ
jgi:hypothetical protein